MVMWRNFRFQYITNVEKSEISPHVAEFQILRTKEIRNFAKFEGVSNFSTWQMWRNLKFTLFLVVKSVFGNFCNFLCKLFVTIYTLLRGKNWARNCIRREKMTNMRYGANKIELFKCNPSLSIAKCQHLRTLDASKRVA